MTTAKRCEQCGDPVKRTGRLFCSRACFYEAQRTDPARREHQAWVIKANMADRLGLIDPQTGEVRFKWSRERIVQSMQRFARQRGRAPRTDEHNRRKDLPSTMMVQHYFPGGLTEARGVAGLVRPRRRVRAVYVRCRHCGRRFRAYTRKAKWCSDRCRGRAATAPAA